MGSIHTHARRDLHLSLTHEQYHWSDKEKDFLVQSVGKQSRSQIAHKLGRSPGAVERMVDRLNVNLTLDDKICEVCGKPFQRKHNNRRRICSPECRRIRQRQWAKRQVGYRTVHAHWRWIFIEDGSHRTYKGMPFFDGWNPKKGGSFRAGAAWIISNLGKRPQGGSLHVVHHDIGFMPGNLEWASAGKQSNQQMFKIIAQQRHRIKELEAELALLKAA